MSERWKYQVKVGGIWGLFMTVFMAFFGVSDKPVLEQMQSGFFYFQMVCFLTVGIFVLGYSSWKAKLKRDERK